MKRVFLFSAFVFAIIMSAAAQHGYGHGHGNGHGYGYSNGRGVYVRPQINVVVTRPVQPVVVYSNPAPVRTCGPAPVYNNTLQGCDYDRAINSISMQTFDDGKLGVANQILNYNYLYSWQVREIMFQFTFDNAKIQFAKMAYNKTIDRENFYVVNDAFTFSSSARDLNRYIY